jgi:hypothetical protein
MLIVAWHWTDGVRKRGRRARLGPAFTRTARPIWGNPGKPSRGHPDAPPSPAFRDLRSTGAPGAAGGSTGRMGWMGWTLAAVTSGSGRASRCVYSHHLLSTRLGLAHGCGTLPNRDCRVPRSFDSSLWPAVKLPTGPITSPHRPLSQRGRDRAHYRSAYVGRPSGPGAKRHETGLTVRPGDIKPAFHAVLADRETCLGGTGGEGVAEVGFLVR